MPFVRRLTFALAIMLGVAACAAPRQSGPVKALPPPSPAESLPDTSSQSGASHSGTSQSGVSESSGFGASNSGGTYPYGSASGTAESPSSAPLVLPSASGVLDADTAAPGKEGVLVKSPDGSYWRKPGAGESQARADSEACYHYAWASTRHDQRINDDRDSAIDTLTSDSRFSALRQSVQGYDQKRRLRSLMQNCMSDKGYLQL